MTLEASSSNIAGIDVAAILSQCRFVVTPALHTALEQLPGGPRHAAGYALGLSEADGTPRTELGGKGLRPTITVLCSQAAGGTAQVAIAGAVAVELVHAFSLVHDDIIDGDERRRHRPSVWKEYGVESAVLTGDALLALAVHTLTAAEGSATATGYLTAALIDLVRGQADDMAFEKRPYDGPDAVTVEEYTEMAAGKTGALLGCSAAVGALLGGGSPAMADALTRIGRHLGVAFQAIDDLLGLSGDPAVTGKPILSDLRRGKKTLPVVHALQSGTSAGNRLAELLASRPSAPAALHQVARLIDAAGGRRFTRQQAKQHLDTALTLISAARLRPPAAQQLSALADFVVSRTH